MTCWHWTSYHCHTSGERLSGFPVIRWGLGLISPFPHRPPHCSFTPSVPWGSRTCFHMISSSPRWLQRAESPFTYLNSWNRGDLLQSRPLFHPLSPWFIHCHRRRNNPACLVRGKAATDFGAGKMSYRYLKTSPLGGRKGVALPHFWKGNGRTGKGNTYRQGRAGLDRVVTGRNWGASWVAQLYLYLEVILEILVWF